MNPASFRRLVGLGFFLAVLCLRAGAQEKSPASVVAPHLREQRNCCPIRWSVTSLLTPCD